MLRRPPLTRPPLLLDRDPADMQHVLGTNVVGAFATIQAFYPLLKVSCSAANLSCGQSGVLTRGCTARGWIAHVKGWAERHRSTPPCASARGAPSHGHIRLASAHAVGCPRSLSRDREGAVYSRSLISSTLVDLTFVLPVAQQKVDGVKAVVTISSLAGEMGPTSESARALDKPAGPLDNAVLAYKISKTALNQGDRPASDASVQLTAWQWEATADNTPRLHGGMSSTNRLNMHVAWTPTISLEPGLPLALYHSVCHARTARAAAISKCTESTVCFILLVTSLSANLNTSSGSKSMPLSALRAVTVQLANELKGEGFTFIAMHPGVIVFPCGTSCHTASGQY